MKPNAHPDTPVEIELKLSVLSPAPSKLVQLLQKAPLLFNISPSRQHLHNTYFDTPTQTLRQARVALRLRRIGSGKNPRWVQTLKMGGTTASALSRRGEWEESVQSEQLSLHALRDSPWPTLDPDGTIFNSLTPSFATRFERTTWVVQTQDESRVEVALDRGSIVAGSHTAPLCELEFELLSGQSSALFDVAQQIAKSVAVVPCGKSKAERGYALAQNTLGMPVRAMPPSLSMDLGLREAARRVLDEAFSQFNANLDSLHTSSAPEVVHQARVGWRRFKSGLKLFKGPLAATPMPSLAALRPLTQALGALRDMEVAATDTLVHLSQTYVSGDIQRATAWESMQAQLQQETQIRRDVLLTALQAPAVGKCLLATARWLEELAQSEKTIKPVKEGKKNLRHWSRQRMERLHHRLNAEMKKEDIPNVQHRSRILAKRLRYGIEALQPLLPKRAQRWHQHATQLQMRLGLQRDAAQAAAIVSNLKVDRGLAEFLRGFAAGHAAG